MSGASSGPLIRRQLPASAWWWLGAAAVTLLGATADVVHTLGGQSARASSGAGTGAATSTTNQVLGEHAQRAPATANANGNGNGNGNDAKPFTISGRAGGLYPGADVPLTLTFTNPNSSAIRVTEVNISVSAASAACASGLLSFGALQPLVVPKNGTAVGTVSTRLSATTPDRCQGVTWNLSYSGQAVKA